MGSWKDKDGNHIEMGLHVFFGCYYNFFGIFRRLGIFDSALRLKTHNHQFVNKVRKGGRARGVWEHGGYFLLFFLSGGCAREGGGMCPRSTHSRFFRCGSLKPLQHGFAREL